MLLFFLLFSLSSFLLLLCTDILEDLGHLFGEEIDDNDVSVLEEVWRDNRNTNFPAPTSSIDKKNVFSEKTFSNNVLVTDFVNNKSSTSTPSKPWIRNDSTDRKNLLFVYNFVIFTGNDVEILF